MKKSFKIIVLAATVATSIATVFVGFSALASTSSSTFIYADKEHTVLPESEPPVYGVNQNGETYGSSAYARTYEEEPDLIAAIGDNGEKGYIRRSESEEEDPSSPEEALRIQNERANQPPRIIPLYAEDGITVLDTFTIGKGQKTITFYYDDTKE